MTSSLNLLFLGVAPGGVYTALHITMQAVSSYLAFSSLPQKWRLFSVALSLRFPSLDVIQHHCSVEPGLSSYAAFRPCYTRLSDLLYLIFYSFFYKKSIIILNPFHSLNFYNSHSISLYLVNQYYFAFLLKEYILFLQYIVFHRLLIYFALLFDMLHLPLTS